MNKFRVQYVIERKTKFLKDFLHSHPYLWLMLKTMKHGKNETYLKRVGFLLNGGQPNALELYDFGKQNDDKNIMIMRLYGKTGLGPLIRRVVHGACLAETIGCVSVVEFIPNTTLYQEDGEFLGTQNVFEYYFEQPEGISLDEAYHSAHVFLCQDHNFVLGARKLGNPAGALGEMYEIDEDYIRNAGIVAAKTLKLNQITRKYIDDSMRRILPHSENSKVIGVHIRGTDFKLHWKHHPNALSPHDFFVAIDEAFNCGFTHVFLATDDSGYVKDFRDKYGEKLLVYDDVHREDGKISTAMVETGRKHEHYLNGLEVIRDMYTLASCSGFIAGLSHVSISARIIKAGLSGPFEYQKILSNGIYHEHQ